MEPITPKSLGASQYILVIVYSYTNFSWVKILKRKEDAKQKLAKVITQAETALEKQVKQTICDGGKEFVNRLMKDFCDIRGIRLTITTPYNPQNNGIAERINRKLMDKARKLMIDSGVPKELWVELINTANFIRVRLSENGKSPFEKPFHRKPNLSQMKIIGC
ncbi:hypothetical protein O181_001926 [Austropuccinia psidii MF-1]|uniref:Integrase catalytic domain-containing protein n=1 Tax=Austropuccinia psidii MF-1 TaxID=1389203 RepID=A0A9Q3BB36_9BASI|nr:hypothetical protein [Austropuccinia psidii MF-1]